MSARTSLELDPLSAFVHGVAALILALRQEMLERQQLGEYVVPTAFLEDVGLGDLVAARADLLAFFEDGGKGCEDRG